MGEMMGLTQLQYQELCSFDEDHRGICPKDGA